MAYVIKEVWAYIATDENDVEGICGFMDVHTKQWLPMVCADQARIDSLRPMAEHIAKQSGLPIKLVRFSVRSDVEEIA